MKKITILIAAIGILTVANANSVKNEKFQQVKIEIIKHLNQKESILKTKINCVNAAQNRKDIKACNIQSRSAIQKIKGEVRTFIHNLKSKI